MNPTPEAHSEEAKLARNSGELCRRIVRGQAATENWSVRVHHVLRIVSIILSALGGAGLIADRVSGHLPGETGWAFWGSAVLLAFGILSQVGNEFQIARRAADSRSLAERCTLCEIQLENILIMDDPRQPVIELLLSVNTTFESERCSGIVPVMTEERELTAGRLGQRLLDRHARHWQFRPLPRRPGRPA